MGTGRLRGDSSESSVVLDDVVSAQQDAGQNGKPGSHYAKEHPVNPKAKHWRHAAHTIKGQDVSHDNQRHFGPHSRFTTRIETLLHGKSYTWEARKHRRNRPQTHEVDAMPDKPPRFTLFNRKIFRGLRASSMSLISFAIGPHFMVGSLLFIVGGVSSIMPGYYEETWSQRKTDLLVNWAYLAGAIVFLVGAYLGVLEAANADLKHDRREWEEHGCKGSKPSMSSAVWPTKVTSAWLSYYGAFGQYLGAILFIVGTVSQTVNAHHMLGEVEYYVLVDAMYLAGGACFTVGSFFMAAEATHSWWRGLLIPLLREHATDIGYWIQWLGFWGSLCFAFGGASGFLFNVLSFEQYQIVTVCTWVLGSFLFLLQGACLYLELMNPRY